MLASNYRRIYHHHLKKCGGTTLNRWLDTFTNDERACNPDLIGTWLFGDRDVEASAERESSYAPRAKALFYWSDVVHNHAAIRRYVPEDTFCLTMLRDPARRVASQVMDWRRLDYVPEYELPWVHQCVADSRQLSLRAYLEQHGRGAGRMLLDNYMTRALAASRIGRTVLDVADVGDLLDVALESLETDYDFVGLIDSFELSQNALCAMIGFPPVAETQALNVSYVAGETDQEMLEARDIIEELTCVDRFVYQRARELFDGRHRDTGQTYDTAAFERLHAARVLDDLKGVRWNDGTRYSVRMPIIGSGLHGRDSPGTASCAVWTGPGRRATLYIPTPPKMEMSLLIWINAYAIERQREQLRATVNGRPAVHHFEHAENCADLLAVDTVSSGEFVRLELELDETVETGVKGTAAYDPRKHGITFSMYGWRPG